MPSYSAHAPGKIILFGEHAVVYGQPAIAIPVHQVRANASVTPEINGDPGVVRIQAPNIDLDTRLDELNLDHPLAAAIEGVTASLGISRIPACTLRVTSTIPVASGLGSGAAVSVAVIRAMAGFLGQPMANEQVSKIAFEVEKIHHGTPSGIDNTVVTFAKPVYFVKGHPIETFNITNPFTIIIGDTGIASPTKETVGDVRLRWQANPKKFEAFFAAVGSITKSARAAIESGHPVRLGPLMNENHALLQEMGVSSPTLDRLVQAALDSGALGAKLSGGGRGGNMIALAATGNEKLISLAFKNAGAIRTITSNIED
ncbi:MAG: mevalonate kinase [Anaerolineales bacterium]|nr:mevalonate kinase [Chloroflexota bacterium]MBL6981872.1 mevalonate kinase [Anaerolineales bacterium]